VASLSPAVTVKAVGAPGSTAGVPDAPLPPLQAASRAMNKAAMQDQSRLQPRPPAGTIKCWWKAADRA